MNNIWFSFLIFPGFLFVSVVGLIFVGVDRKLSARFQWRIGPPIWQPFIDFMKLLTKEVVVPSNVHRFVFFLSPLLGLSGVIVASLLLFRASLNPQTAFVGDLIVFIYLLLLPPLAIILGGSSSGNPLASMGTSREMKMILSYELPFILAIFTAVVKVGSLRMGDFILYQSQKGALFLHYPSCVFAFISAFMVIHAKLALAPFDIPEGETEIMAGPLIEYSGPLLGIFYLVRAILYFTLPAFLVFIFWGGITFGGGGAVLSLLKILLVLFFIIVVKNINPRIRIDQAMRFFWTRVFVLSIIGMGLAIVGW
ncbi:NADH-quinone oxidoreductase subunit H [Candidatus Calescamantes bacterium]|nr:NADH-quinone oxidoreductase subunit H [Candidatus Calescamantes bacterium]